MITTQPSHWATSLASSAYLCHNFPRFRLVPLTPPHSSTPPDSGRVRSRRKGKWFLDYWHDIGGMCQLVVLVYMADRAHLVICTIILIHSYFGFTRPFHSSKIAVLIELGLVERFSNIAGQSPSTPCCRIASYINPHPGHRFPVPRIRGRCWQLSKLAPEYLAAPTPAIRPHSLRGIN